MDTSDFEPMYQYNENPLFALPREESLFLLFRALDALEEPVLIVDQDTRICYFNTAYVHTYSESFRKNNVMVDEIKNWRLTNMRDHPDVKPILDVLQTNMPRLKYYSAVGGVHTAFSDIIPLKVADQMVGAVIISRDTAQIARMSHDMNHYKAVANELRQELEAKNSLPLPFRSIIGSASSFMKVLRTAAQVAPFNTTVCISGESGTGKEVIAQAIHFSSSRSGGPLIKVNCSAIPENLIESELFGYERGAFTGAKTSGNMGKFELANRGTLFLDEIGEMPLSMQAKLLRALQEREITRVGGSRPVSLDFRLITATNRDLEDMVANGAFRKDLYYRINVIPLHLPPLRERRNDIAILANHFLKEIRGEAVSFASEVLNLFCRYPWPGNIRELKNCIERIAVLSRDDIIGTEFLPKQILECTTHYGQPAAESYRLQGILEKVERDTIQAVLNLTGGNRAQAIKILGISKRSFYMKLERYHLK